VQVERLLTALGELKGSRKTELGPISKTEGHMRNTENINKEITRKII